MRDELTAQIALTSYSQALAFPPSEQFTALCQAQLRVLVESLGAKGSAVYLTQEGQGPDARVEFCAVAEYPSSASLFLTAAPLEEMGNRLRDTSDTAAIAFAPERLSSSPDIERVSHPYPGVTVPDLETPEGRSHQEFQWLLPLRYEERMMGFLMVGRLDREWRMEELRQLDPVANTLAIALILDQRQIWLQQQLQQQHQWRIWQQKRIDTLFHQLRNPIAAVRTFSKLLLKRFQAEDRNYSVAQGLLKESDRLQDLLHMFVEDTESVAEFKVVPGATTSLLPPAADSPTINAGLESGMETTSVTLQPLFVELGNTFGAIAEEQGIYFTVALPPMDVMVLAQEQKLREILSNLLDNAVKYTPRGGQVTLAWQSAIQSAITTGQADAAAVKAPQLTQGIVVKDTGYGIPMADQTRLFERGFRGEKSNSSIPGSGLGLAIAKEWLEAMGGRIEVQSPNPAPTSSTLPGSVFWVWLPTPADSVQIE